MGNCKSDASDVRCKKGGERNVTLALFGLDNAGKTVTAKGFLGEEVETPTPTIGFSSVDFRHGRHNITMFDLGGGRNIRGIWKNYFAEIHGMIFIVDASAPSRLDECKMALAGLLKDEMIQGKPLLLLANKQDITGAMDEMDICDRMQLEDLVNAHKTPCRMESCSAVVRKNQKMDKSIHDGFCWLLELVEEKWNELDERVKRDFARKEAKERQEKAERAERVRRSRELRELEQKENRHLKDEANEDGEDDVDAGNPFMPIKHQLERAQKNEIKKRREGKTRECDAGRKSSSKSHPGSNSSDKALQKHSMKSKRSSDNDEDTIHRTSARRNHKSDSEEELKERPSKRSNHSAERPSMRSNHSTERPSMRSNHRLNLEDDVIQRSTARSRSRSDFEEERFSTRSKHRLDKENSGPRPKPSSSHRTDTDEEAPGIRKLRNWNQPLKPISPTRITRLKNGSDDNVTDDDEGGSGSVVPSRKSYTRILTPPVPLRRALDADDHRQWNGRSTAGDVVLNNDKKKKKKARFNQTAPAIGPSEPHSSWKNSTSASFFVGPGDPFHSSSAHPVRAQDRSSRTPLLERLIQAKAAEESSLKQRSKLTNDDDEDEDAEDDDRFRTNTRNYVSSQNPKSPIHGTRKPNSHDYDYDNVSEGDGDDIVV